MLALHYLALGISSLATCEFASAGCGDFKTIADSGYIE